VEAAEVEFPVRLRLAFIATHLDGGFPVADQRFEFLVLRSGLSRLLGAGKRRGDAERQNHSQQTDFHGRISQGANAGRSASATRRTWPAHPKTLKLDMSHAGMSPAQAKERVSARW